MVQFGNLVVIMEEFDNDKDTMEIDSLEIEVNYFFMRKKKYQ